MWINADERLPEEGRKYLVYFPEGSYSGELWVCDGYTYGREWEKARGTWNVPDGLGGYYEGDCDPSDEPMAGTFYMELPEAPVKK